MRYELVAGVIAVSQVSLALLVAALDSATRARGGAARDRRTDSATPGTPGATGAPTVQRLLSGAASADEMVAAIQHTRSVDATQALVMFAMERIPSCEREALARRLRAEPRVRRIISGSRSPLWWKRLSAARVLTLVSDESDRPAIRRLLADSHPAVQSAAAGCLTRQADEESLARVIDGLSSASSAVREYQLKVLSEHARIAAPLLLDRIRADAPPHKLYAYVHAVTAVGDAACMARVADLSTHAHPEVRVAVARVLRGTPGDSSHIKLLSMLRDPDWRVRAQAARGLSVLSDQATVVELVRALADPTWWVRFRAGLALAGMGDVGRDALNGAREHPDRYARDMAVLVSGLSDASVMELAAG